MNGSFTSLNDSIHKMAKGRAKMKENRRQEGGRGGRVYQVNRNWSVLEEDLIKT